MRFMFVIKVGLLFATVFADNDIFGDELIEVGRAAIERHVASSIEDLSSLFCREQKFLESLSNFKAQIVNYYGVKNRGKPDECIVNIINKLEKYQINPPPTSDEQCTEHVSNPIHSFLLLKRLTKIWSQKLKALKINLKSLSKSTRQKLYFPQEEMSALHIPEDSDYSEVLCFFGCVLQQSFQREELWDSLISLVSIT